MPTARLARRTLAGLTFAALAAPAGAQQAVTSPEKFFGHRIGADYRLPNYTRFTAYWRQLDGESERMRVLDIGKTAEGRTQLMAIITAPENFRNLARYKEISQRLARAEGLTEAQARELAAEGKAVVWIDGGLHATEVLGAQQLMETVHQLVSRDDAETRRILRDVIVLAVHANPDGMELVSDWYMREPDSLKRTTAGVPRLYQKYIGHDNNRDFYMSTQPESENMNRQLYHEWFPQIMYNHHQTGPTGTVMFAPPFRDPFNYQLDPLIVTGLDLVGAAMHNRFIAEDKGGVTMRRGANYSTWWNGGLRTTVYFHNMIGLLTETIGNPTPMRIPFVANRQLPSADLPRPIAPQEWRFRNSIDYSVTANYAVLDVASRYKDTFLYNIWRMGRNSIERGGRDTWTVSPSRLDAVRDSMGAARTAAGAAAGAPAGVMTAGGQFGGAASPEASQRAMAMMRRPETRDPRGYVLPADQPDFPRVVHLINALRENGITVHRATAAFTAGGTRYPAGSYVLKTAQPFRPHVLDMFEPQDHPNDFLYPGGPPIPPYDAAGWTLAYQMGVKFDRILEAFDGTFEEVKEWNVRPAPGRVAAGTAPGYVLSSRYNDAYPAALRLVAAGEEVHRLAAPHAGHPAGSFYVVAGPSTRARLGPIAAELGLDVPAAARPAAGLTRIRAPRVALWDRYGGSMPSGWTRWLLEQKKIPFDVVYASQLDAGGLRAKYDAIILVDGAIPARDGQGGGGGGGGGGEPRADAVPAEFRAALGNTSVARTVPQLKQFLEQGGTVITIGGSTALARHLGLPVGDKLVDAQGKALPREQFYVPGSVLRVRVDTTAAAAFGMEAQTDVFFDDSPAFTLGPDAEARGLRRVAWYDSAKPLRSGWAWGQQHLEGGAAAVEAKVGQGTLYLFGPEILYRAQPHGTFKFLFNSLAASAAGTGAIQ